MRRLCLLVLFLLLVLPLCAVSLSCAPGVELDSAVVERVEEGINKYGRAVIPADVTSLEITSAQRQGSSLILTIGPYTVAFDASHLNSSIDEELSAFFAYPPFLPDSEGPLLDYIWQTSYSSVSLSDARRGQIYDLISASDGRASARFIVSDVSSERVILDPVHIGSASAGLRLERKSAFRLTVSANQVFSPQWLCFFSLRAKNTALLYPFSLSIGFESGRDENDTVYFTALAGLEYTLYLGALINSDFTLIQDGHLFAGMDIAFGWADGFTWGASWRAGYEHALTNHFSWSAGFEYIILRNEETDQNVLMQYRLTLGLGVMF